MIDKRIYGFVTVGSKGQIVIPADAREALGIVPGDHLFVVGKDGGNMLAIMPEAGAVELINKINKSVEDFEQARERGPETADEEE